MPGSVYSRGSIWWITFRHKGKKFRHSANTDKKREADKLLAFYLGQVARGEFKGFELQRRGLTLFACWTISLLTMLIAACGMFR